jgi:iron complex transport system substrate-binding protein
MNKKVAIISVIGIMILIGAIVVTQLLNNKNEKVGDLTIKHDLGETQVNINPKRVVVFDYGVLDVLDVFGVEVVGLPKASLPTPLQKYNEKTYADAGSLKEPDFEAIFEMKPDLIIISGRQSDLYDQFTEIAPTIFLGIDNANYLSSLKKNVETLGLIFEKEQEAEEKLANIDEAILRVTSKTALSQDKALITLVTGGAISAYGEGSRFGIIHDVLGVEAVDKDLKVSTHGQSVTFEYISSKNPGILFVVDRDAVVEGNSGAEQVLNNDLVKTTNAYKNNKIIYLNPEDWYIAVGGLNSTLRMIQEIEAVFN